MVHQFARALSESAGIGVLNLPTGVGDQASAQPRTSRLSRYSARDVIIGVNGRASNLGMWGKSGRWGARSRRVTLKFFAGKSVYPKVGGKIGTLNDFGEPALIDGVAYIPLMV